MESLRKQAARILREKKKYKLWLTAFLCMAVLVTAGTVAALTMNGQALNRKEKLLICGLDVHGHTEQCRDSEGELVCGQADYVIHIHNDDCYGEDGALVCALPERKPHVHDAACLEEQKTLTCTLEETQGHQHDEACYTKVQGELTCSQDGAGHQHGPECYTKVQGEPICGTDGTGHQHGPACYAKVQGELTCASTEEGHEHNEGCYAWSEELTCGLAEEVHEHTDECYAWSEELTCGLAEEAHEHTDDCYAWSEELNCEIPEGEDAHAHTEDCYTIEENYICGELELHAHEEDCYDEEGNLICEEIELLEHVHADDCFEIIEPDASGEESEESNQESGASEESQEGNAAADESGAENSEAEEDSEGEPEDSEGEEEQAFQKTYEDAEIRVVAEYHKSANIPEEAQLVAERIGTEAEGDAPEAAEEDGDDAADGQDMDDAQGADETDGTQDSQGSDGTASEQAPVESEAGDGTDGAEDGIEPVVDEVADPTEPEGQSGDAEPEDDGEAAASEETVTEEVSYRLKFLADGKEIEPEGTVTFTVWNLEEEDGEPQVIVYEAGDGLDAMVVTLKKTVAVEAAGIFCKTYEDDKVKVVAEYGESANIPEEAELIARQITAESHPELYAEYKEKFKEAVDDEKIVMTNLFDIGFYLNGEEIEPDDTVTVRVQFLDEEGQATDETTTVVHFAEESTEVLDGSKADEDGSVTFTTESFSAFGFAKMSAFTFAMGRNTGNVNFHQKNGDSWKVIPELEVPKAMLQNMWSGDFVEIDTKKYFYISAMNDYVFYVEGYMPALMQQMRAEDSTSRWVAYSTNNGETITTAILQSVNNVWVWVFEGEIASPEDITDIYFLINNETKLVDEPLSEFVVEEKVELTDTSKIIINPGNRNCDESQRKQYGLLPRITLKVANTVDKKAKIILPSDNELGNAYNLFADDSVNGNVKVITEAGDEVEASNYKVTIARDSGERRYKLVGWYDVIKEEYYDVSNGSCEVEVGFTDKPHIYYADWIDESYDFHDSSPTIETEDTHDFVTVRVYDYNELFNVYGATVFNEEEQRNEFSSKEIWENNGFVFWEGTGGNAESQDESIFSVSNQSSTNGAVQQVWGGLSNEELISRLFPEDGASAVGVHYLGKGNHLFQHVGKAGEVGKYVYDSNLHAAAYQQSEERFYVYQNSKNGPNNKTSFLPFNRFSDNLSNAMAINGKVNYFFGMSCEINFDLPADVGSGGNLVDGAPMVFKFSGDDDVWVYVENLKTGEKNLVLDLGGIHDRVEGQIDFTNGNVTISGADISPGDVPQKLTDTVKGLKKGSYKMTVYYLERGAGGSNCMIEFNTVPPYKIQTAIADALEVTKEWKNTEGAHIPDSVELSLYRKADFVKWNGIINNQEKLKELQEKLNLSGTDFAEFQSKLEAEMNACKENFEYVNSVKLKTNGEESVSYTWEGLSPYFKYEVREKEIPSYISKVIPAQSGSSYYYWVETNSISSNEIIILSSDTTKALAYIDGKLGEKDVNVQNGVIVTPTIVDGETGIVQGQKMPDEIIWKVNSNGDGKFSLQCKDGLYLSLSGSEIMLSPQPSYFELDYKQGNGLCNNENRIVYDNGFIAMKNNNNDGDNEETARLRARIYEMKDIKPQVHRYTVTNTYVPNIVIQKIDSEDGEVIRKEDGKNAFFSLTRMITDNSQGADGKERQEVEYSYYDAINKSWIVTGDDAEKTIGQTRPENGETPTGWFELSDGSLEFKDLPDGVYTLTEREAPDGCKLPDGGNNVIVFTIENARIKEDLTSGKLSDGKTDVAQVVGANKLVLSVKNEKDAPTTAKVSFYKYMSGSNPTPSPLQDAKFDLYRLWTAEDDRNPALTKDELEGREVVKIAGEVTSDKDGLFYTDDLICGTYYLKETHAPDGFNMLSSVIEIQVEEVESSTNPAVKDIKVSIDDQKISTDVAQVVKKDGVYTVKVFNTYGFELPETGGTGTKPYTIGGAALATAAVFLMYGYSMRRKKSERRSKQ